MKDIYFYNINNLHIRETDLDSMAEEVEDRFLYSDDEIVIYELLYIIAIISLDDKRYNSIDGLPSKVRDIVLKEMV